MEQPEPQAADELVGPRFPKLPIAEAPRKLPVESSRLKPRSAIRRTSTESAEQLPEPAEPKAPPLPEGALPGVEDAAPLRGSDPFPDERIPAAPSDEFSIPRSTEPETPTMPDQGESCETHRTECQALIDELRRRDITTVYIGLVQGGEDGKAAIEGQDYPCECKMPAVQFEPRQWCQTVMTWKATGLCHKPLYFEDVQLERYGHSWNPVVQPFMSAAHFFVSVPLLPYKIGLNPPGECIYTLGYYRPGNCAPYLIDPIPFSLRGALFEGVAGLGFAYLFFPPAI